MKTTAYERRVMGKRFKRLRRKLCLSQEAFGKLIGRSRVPITKIESALTYPQYTTLQRFMALEAKHSGTNGVRSFPVESKC